MDTFIQYIMYIFFLSDSKADSNPDCDSLSDSGSDSVAICAPPLRYLVFYCPWDLLYCCAALLPFRLVLSGMKEVTRTWKVLGGVSQASIKYQDSLLVMIAIGWAKGWSRYSLSLGIEVLYGSSIGLGHQNASWELLLGMHRHFERNEESCTTLKILNLHQFTVTSANETLF